MQNAVAITKPISYKELMSGQRIDFIQRYANFIKTKPLMRLVADENALKESITNAQRALQNAQNKDMSSVLNELNDKRARLDEIDIFLGRVEESSPAVERAKARYGDEYKQIIVDKINKESEQGGGSDIVFAPQRAKNLYEWHKDSSPLTKETDGTPKVFYHGNKDNDTSFEAFELKRGADTSTPAAFFSTDESVAKSYVRGAKAETAKTFKVFLNVKKPLIIDFEGRYYIDKNELADKIFKGEKWFDLAVNKALKNGDYDGIIFKNIKDNRYGKGEVISDTIAVFNPNQIKSVNNKGTFDGTNPNILMANQHLGAGLLGGSINGIETDENGNVIGFNPSKFLQGFAVGAGGSLAFTKAIQNPKIKAGLEKFATMQRVKAKKENKMHYDTLIKIDKSPKFGSKMELIGKENLNAEVLKYALIKKKRIAVNKLDKNTAKMLNFHYPHDVRRTIQPDEVEHTLQRHGTESNLVKFSGQKPVTLDDIAKYQDYADSAEVKKTSQDKKKNNVLVSLKQLDNEFIVVVEQVRKLHNELGFKTMYFEKGILDEETIERLTTSKRKGA